MKGSALVDRWQQSPNFEARADGFQPSLIVLHYTGMQSGSAAVDWLCNPISKVSCHYLVDEDGTIVQMVGEDLRAWHAGQSCWLGETDTNSTSIGIEIQNGGHAEGCPEFPAEQMQRVIALCLDIMVRHGLGPQQIVAHSDVAPGRKIDPGEAFDWALLARAGIGTLVRSSDAARHTAVPAQNGTDDIRKLQDQLVRLGYGVDVSGVYDQRTRIVLEAFQRRYRPALVSGMCDAETQDIAERLMAVQPQSLRTS